MNHFSIYELLWLFLIYSFAGWCAGVIYSAAKANPQDSFTVLTQAFMMPVFMNRPSNLEVIGISTKGAEKTLLGLLRFTSALVKFDYDIVLDLQDVIRTWIICAAFRMKGKPVYVLDKIRKKYPPLMRRENKKLEPLPTVIVCRRVPCGRIGLYRIFYFFI